MLFENTLDVFLWYDNPIFEKNDFNSDAFTQINSTLKVQLNQITWNDKWSRNCDVCITFNLKN